MDNKKALELLNKGILKKGCQVKMSIKGLEEFTTIDDAYEKAPRPGEMEDSWVIVIINDQPYDVSWITEIKPGDIEPSCAIIPKGNVVKEFNGESCSWCKNEENCTYNRRHMEYTREAIKNVVYCTKAYCSAKVTCDYYIKDKDKYYQYNIGECAK